MIIKIRNKTRQNRDKLGAGFFCVFIFKANENQNKTNKKYTKQDNNKTVCKDV